MIDLLGGSRWTPSVQDMVNAFHRKFGILAPEEFKVPSRGRRFARLNWIWEETDELNRAIDNEDVIETLDALADIIYFCYGMAVELGVDLEPVIAEVHRTNLAKEGGNTRLDGKLIKPPGWCPPDIAGVLAKQGITIDQYGHPKDRTPTLATPERPVIGGGVNEDGRSGTHTPTTAVGGCPDCDQGSSGDADVHDTER